MQVDSLDAALQLLHDRDAFRVMVDAAEDIHGTGVSFNVVIGDALRAVVNTKAKQGESTSIHGQFIDLKYHAKEMDQTPTRWVVGRGVVEAVRKSMGMPASISDRDDIKYLGIPMERSVDMPDGRVTLKCDEWSAGAFTLEEAE